MAKRNSQNNLLLRRKRKMREVHSAFRFLIATPHDLAADPVLVMPGPGRLVLSHSAALAQGEITISVEGGRSWTTKALVANAMGLGNHAEDNARVTQVGAPSGTLSLHVQNPLNGTFAKIATLVVA